MPLSASVQLNSNNNLQSSSVIPNSIVLNSNSKNINKFGDFDDHIGTYVDSHPDNQHFRYICPIGSVFRNVSVREI